uniref:Uncharacterized protein n=1 Tax=Trichinella nativa TaxID=6335 RepID=A0A0V1KI14_9BILA
MRHKHSMTWNMARHTEYMKKENSTVTWKMARDSEKLQK